MKRSYFYGKLLAACALVVLMCACDTDLSGEFGLNKLQKGVATEADVRNLKGAPASIYEEGEGVRTLEYPKGPEGVTTWMVRIAADGVMSGYEQVLTQSHFDQVFIGMTREQVRRLLGRPRSIVPFPRKQEEVWDWKYLHVHEQRLFNVHFDIDSGKVVAVSISEMSGY